MSLSFALMVCHRPDDVLMGRHAVAFARQLLDQGHRLDCVFFYGAGGGVALDRVILSRDDFNPGRAWQTLAHAHGLELAVCVGSGERWGVVEDSVLPGFTITGLGRWLMAVSRTDRVARFP